MLKALKAMDESTFRNPWNARTARNAYGQDNTKQIHDGAKHARDDLYENDLC